MKAAANTVTENNSTIWCSMCGWFEGSGIPPTVENKGKTTFQW